MSGPHTILPALVYPDVTCAAGTAPTALTDDPGNSIIDGNIHHMIAYGPLVGFLAPVGLNKGDIHGVFLSIHRNMITAVEFP